ncbi:MAG TPA: YcnI family protein [Acidimicrobiales bacterium]
MRTSTRLVSAGAVAGLALLATASPATAHVSPDKTEVPVGAYTSVALTTGHGCEDSPTTSMAIQIPESIPNVTPAIVAGWDVAIETVPLDEPLEGSHGSQINEREAVVTYTAQPGQELADGFRQSFTIGFQAPDAPGELLFFKTIQTCVEGETAWIEEHTGEGEEPETPAPLVRVVAAGDDGDASLVTESAGADADGSDDDGGGSDALAIAGLVAGLVGLAAGGTALVRTQAGARRS